MEFKEFGELIRNDVLGRNIKAKESKHLLECKQQRTLLEENLLKEIEDPLNMITT